MGDGLRLALTTLTVLPLRGPRALDRGTAGTAMALAPLVGLLLGTLAAAVLQLVGALTEGGGLLPAALTVATLAAATRGLHLDGLADTADGLGSYLPAEQARQVMKAPDVGALGLVAVVLTLLVQVAALAACTAADRGAPAVVLAAVLARTQVTAACTRATPAAAPNGLGALVAGTVRPAVAALLTAATVLLAAAWLAATGPCSPLGDAARVAASAVVAVAAATALRRHAVRRLGGITGDVLGAVVETTTTVLLVGMALG